MYLPLPYRSGGRSTQKETDLEAQAENPSLAGEPSKRIPESGGDDTGEDGRDDATALQVLDEAYFVTPNPPPPPLPQSDTLLPVPVAKMVSASTGLGTFTIRSYARAFEWGMHIGRETTLRSLELTRAGIEVLLKVSAKDISNRREHDSELARADTENVLARSISTLHWAFTGATFATSAGFTISSAYLQGLEQVTLQGLSTLNAILGDTESSRAVSAIITLIKEELTRPGAENGLVPGYWDLIVGCAGFVILQRMGRRKTALEFKGNGGEETIWDLVIDDKGFRADVVGTRRDGGNEVTATKSLTTARAGTDGVENDGLLLERGLDLDLPPTIILSAQDQTNLSDEEIRDRIVAQLPPGTKAVITSNTVTLKTIQVEIHGSEAAHIEAPPGLTMISEHLEMDNTNSDLPSQTIVFRTSLKRSSSAEIEPIDQLKMTSIDQHAYETGEIEESGLVMKSPKRRKSFVSGSGDPTIDYLDIERSSPKTWAEQNGPVANQKKSRKPVSFGQQANPSKLPVRSKKEPDPDKEAKVGIIKKALNTLTPNQKPSKKHEQQTQPSSSTQRRENMFQPGIAPLSRMTESTQPSAKRIYPMPEGTDRSVTISPSRSPAARRETSTSFFTMHEKKRESTVSQTDSFSIHSADSRPGSPTSFRTHARSESELSKVKSHVEMSLQPNLRMEADETGSSRHHVRSRSFVPSLYSMGTKNSDEAIILQPKTPVHRSIFEDHKMLTALANDGIVPGMFPNRHLVKSIHRFARFASASYGSNFLRVMGITNPEGPLSKSTELVMEEIHHEHSSFATHTGLPADTILLSGFCDPKGAHVSVSKNQPTMMPLMHFISIDHDSKAIVLTCRGTLGFEDVLTDMTCDYDNFSWQGTIYQVHQGIHASARRMLDGAGRRVMSTIQTSLEEYPDYGLILCGHSLGGAVAAVLALLISEPNKNRTASYFDSEQDPETGTGTSFVTAATQKLLTSSGNRATSVPPVSLPPGRPIHVFAYGPPASFSPTLRLATRGLITTIINHNDVVPTLSLGTLQDFKAVAIHLKQDPSSPLVRLRSSMVERVKHAMLGHFWNRESATPPPVPSSGIPTGENEEDWQWTALATIRNLMINDKLLPPGEVFLVETSRVFDRLNSDSDTTSVSGNAPTDSTYRPLGRAATRVQFKLIRNVESKLREIKFGSGMFGDHSPGRYEGGLGALERGIFEEI